MARLRANSKKVDEVEVIEVGVETPEVEVKAEEVEAPTTIDVIDKAVATAKTVEVTKELDTKEPNVRVNPKQDIRTYIGDQWYNLKAGKVVSVPKTVKDKLQRAGLLSAI